MTQPRTAEQLWRWFQRASIPSTAPAMQHQEMKKAFYAGMAALLAEMENFDESMTDEAGADVLESWKQELIKAFESFSVGGRS